MNWVFISQKTIFFIVTGVKPHILQEIEEFWARTLRISGCETQNGPRNRVDTTRPSGAGCQLPVPCDAAEEVPP
jgi:hypothetical protein